MIGGLQGDFGELDIKYLKMSVANIGKLQENTSSLCKIGCETLWLSAIRGSGYVYPEKLKLPPLPSDVRIPDVRHPDGMAAATGWNSYPGGMWW